jgi:hypothetical protein
MPGVVIGVGIPDRWMWKAEVVRVLQPAPRHPSNGLDLACHHISAQLLDPAVPSALEASLATLGHWHPSALASIHTLGGQRLR